MSLSYELLLIFGHPAQTSTRSQLHVAIVNNDRIDHLETPSPPLVITQHTIVTLSIQSPDNIMINVFGEQKPRK